MKHKIDYKELFNKCNSYSEMRLMVELNGGNKAQMNKFLQRFYSILSHIAISYRDPTKRKLILFIKQGIMMKEISMKFLWNMLDCPNSIDELYSKIK